MSDHEADDKKTPKKRLTIADIFNIISLRGFSIGTILAIVCNWLLTNIGWNSDATFGGAFDNLNPDTAKTLLTAAAAVVGVLFDKMPEMAAYVRQLLSQSDVMPRREIQDSLDLLHTKVDAVKKVTDNLQLR